MTPTSAGWLPCDNPEAHEPHEWVYVDPNTRLAVVCTCDGEPQPTEEPA